MKKTFFCPGNVPSSKNSRVWTGKYFVVSKATTKWRKLTKQWWEENKEDFVSAIANEKKPIKLGIYFIRGQKREYDWVNPVQTIQDEMVKHGWIEDDSIAYMFPFPLEINNEYSGYNKEEPGVILKIL